MALLLVGCARSANPGPNPAAPAALAPPPDAAAGVQDPALASLLREDWEARMIASPVWASELGDHRFDHLLGDPSPAAREARRSQADARLTRARAIQPATAADQLTLQLWLTEAEAEVAGRVCRFELWSFGPRDNPLGDLGGIVQAHRLPDARDGANLLRRLEAFPATVDARILDLRAGLGEGRVVDRVSAERVLDMLARDLAAGEQGLAFQPARDALASWAPAEREAFQARVRTLAAGPLRESLERFQAFVRDEVVPVARPAGKEGVGALPEGGACYAAQVQHHTTLPVGPDELHAAGVAEMARIHEEIRVVGQRVFGTGEVARILSRLRTDPQLRFSSGAAIEAKAREAVARASAAVPAVLIEPPTAPCDVRPIPDFEAPFTTVAYYRPASTDGRAGAYYVNTYAPETRLAFEAEALAFHEAIPGHHTQIAVAQGLGSLPLFRRHGGFSAHVEGWALYAERLADELGLYSSDLDRLGMLSFDAWRASRLVVDTGIHHLGWSRERAEAWMLEKTALSPENIRNEVDRYVTWPGQALAYKSGQMRIRRWRQTAQGTLGAEFDLAAFHHQLLAEGSLPLSVLEERMQAWVQAGGPRPTRGPTGEAAGDGSPTATAGPEGG